MAIFCPCGAPQPLNWFSWKWHIWLQSIASKLLLITAPCRLRGCKNRPAPFPGRISYKATKPGLICLSYLSMFFIVLLFIRAPCLCIISFRWYMFSLLIVLVKLLVLAKWLARKTPLRKSNRGEGIIFIKPRPKGAYDYVGLLSSFIV